MTIKWKSIFPSCFKANNNRILDSRSHVSIHNSNSRISLSDISDPGSPLCLSDLSTSKFASNLHIFTLVELKLITRDFSSSNFLGEGGFGPVHKGFVDDKCRPGLTAQPVAVKLLDLDGDQGHREWLVSIFIPVVYCYYMIIKEIHLNSFVTNIFENIYYRLK